MDLELERTAKLIQAARAGRRDAYEELFAAYRGDLERAMKHRLRPGASPRFDASDVVQETLADAVAHFVSFEHRGPGSFRRWLVRILENRLKMTLQRESAEMRDRAREVGLTSAAQGSIAEASATSPSAAAAKGEDRERIQRVLARLPRDHAEVIRLVKLRERSIAQVAHAMGRTENAVKKLLARALLSLRDELRDVP